MPKLNVQQNNQNVIQAFKNALAIGNLKGIIASDGNHNFSTAGSNRNLFDNPFFTINQRGLTSYSAGYSVDRWVVTSNASINVLSDGVELTTTANRWGMEQRCVKNLIPHGSTVTFSALIDDGEIVQGSFVWNGANVNLYPDGADVGLEINTAPTAYDRWYVCNRIASTHTIHAVKIEIGSVSTLANDGPPELSIARIPCYESFLRLKGAYAPVGYAIAVSTTLAIVVIPTPVTMRAVPSASLSGTLYFNAGTPFAVTGLASNGTTLGVNQISQQITGSFDVGKVYLAQFRDANSYLDLSANL